MKKQIAITLLLSTGIAMAAEEPQAKPWYEEARLFDGRTSLEESGISPFLYFDSIYGANVDGGVKTDEDFTAQIYAGADLDLEKLLGWDNTVMKISMVNRQGNGVGPNVGGIYDPMCIYGGPAGQVAWLYQLWLEKTCGDLAVKFGRTSMDEDFANNDLYRYSLSTAINGPIRSMMLDGPQIYSFPLGLWGGRIKYNPSEQHQFQLGAYQINDSIWSDYVKGTDWSFRSNDGVTLMAQYDWTPEINDRPARLYLGIADSIYDYTDLDGVGETDNLFRVYGHFDFEVVENLKLFTFGAYTHQDETASVPLQINAGANWKGLIPGRENDHTMAFVTYGELSDDYRSAKGIASEAEVVYELGHRIQIIPSFYIQPSVQYVQDPGADATAADAVVLGAWIGASF